MIDEFLSHNCWLISYEHSESLHSSLAQIDIKEKYSLPFVIW